MADNFRAQFAEIEAIEDHRRRGYEFEGLIRRVCRAAHFNVRSNPDAARPRQTDLIAYRGSEVYVVETKWLESQAGSDDVDNLQSRLKRIPRPACGVLINIGGFNDSALREIDASRTEREVLAIDRSDVELFVEDPSAFSRTLRERRQRLLIEGTISGLTLDRKGRPSGSLGERQLDSVAPVFVKNEGRSRVIGAPGGYIGFTFCREIHDIDWVPAGGAGVSWDLPLAVEGHQELASVLAELDEIGWTSADAQWSITQSDWNWHGLGCASLREAVLEREKRYRDLEGFHHTEKLSYADRCVDGFYTLSADLAAQGHLRVWHPQLSFQLSGVPLDAEPFARLAEAVGVGAPYFRPREERSVRRQFLDIPEPLEILAFVVSHDDDDDVGDWVNGLVAKNPFSRNRDLSEEAKIDPAVVEVDLSEGDLIICDLRSWHPLGEEHTYTLRRLEWAHSSETGLISFLADW